MLALGLYAELSVAMPTPQAGRLEVFKLPHGMLCHEFCHHLDFHLFKFEDSWHTRGFYERTALLYHHAKGTPLKKLVWAPVSGGRWRIDWQRTRRS